MLSQNKSFEVVARYKRVLGEEYNAEGRRLEGQVRQLFLKKEGVDV